jgi:hypothetical protein
MAQYTLGLPSLVSLSIALSSYLTKTMRGASRFGIFPIWNGRA